VVPAVSHDVGNGGPISLFPWWSSRVSVHHSSHVFLSETFWATDSSRDAAVVNRSSIPGMDRSVARFHSCCVIIVGHFRRK
jgi:hypothetical protein